MGKIRVLIADDSSLARSLLRDFLENENDIEVVGEATDGRQAVALARELKPAIITMDLEMPHMNGFEAIEEIMYSKAVPILVVSSVSDAAKALDAMGRGALEVVAKPDCSVEKAAEFVAKVRLLAGVSVITRMRPRQIAAFPETQVEPLKHEPTAAQISILPSGISATIYPRVFAIASSTGGPQALAQILPALPADFACPIVIAQHISDGFAEGMAEWLGSLCQLPVRMATEGQLLQAGVIHISPSERHLSITPARRLALLERGPRDIYRPSCDVLLDSVANVFGHQAVGIILTGMGSDGAKGMAHIHQRGGMTLGQDEASSVIYGMNRVAIESGAIHRVIDVAQIADEIVRLSRPFVFSSMP